MTTRTQRRASSALVEMAWRQRLAEAREARGELRYAGINPQSTMFVLAEDAPTGLPEDEIFATLQRDYA